MTQSSFSISSKDICYDANSDLIGEGETCFVYTAHHAHFGKVALKKLKKDFRIVHPYYETIMRREARCLKMLRHPNIVQFIGMVWEQDFHAIVMEYLCNEDLLTFLTKHTQNVYVKAKLLCDVAEGLSYLHLLPKCIIHNDLKAANILISQHVEAKISDFGLADWISCTTELFYGNHEKPRGASRTHQSPESWLDINKVTTKSDVYSFGILMWEVYSEEKPFANRSTEAIKLAVIDGQRPDLQLLSKRMPECLVKLMERCWRQEQLERPDMTIVVNDIQLLLSEEDIKSELVKAIVNLLNSSYRPSSNLGPELTHRSETNSEKKEK